MHRSLLALTLLLAAPAALAEDPPAGNDPAGDAPPAATDAAPPAEKAPERKVDEKALEMLLAWGKKMHQPSHGTSTEITSYATAKGSIFGGGDLDVKSTWHREKGLTLTVTLPEALKKKLPPAAQLMTKNMFSTWSREALAPVLESPAHYAADYDVHLRKVGERELVELLPFTETAQTEMQRLYFDENGLCDRRLLIPRVDPSDPNQAMMVGVEIESSFGYEKIGDRHVMRRMSMLLPFGDLLVEYDYFEVSNGPPLLKTMRMTTPFAADPIEVSFHDYSLDGTLLESTKPQPEAGTDDGEGETPDAGAGDDPDGSDGSSGEHDSD